ncbi:hypothetical protein OSB04_006585 [Centaurea solstitialis]|uniref:Retrotransposon protein, putative, Ty1-copia subclass n=1 Tax=Centaurea solstitialis TaxID=347529 RepID=A0AA38WQD3_9ASTR|nr:hypothetical protein OSB04_006585 [Centaurea solstitialis]
MASTVTSTNNLSLRSILEKDKLTGPNFLDWERNLMIVLRHERKWYVLEEPLGEAPPANAPAAARNAHKKHSDDLLDVACLMLATMSPDLQAGLINTNAYDMIRQLRDMFQTQARTERYDATKAFNECKMVKGTSVSDHVMKMKRHLDHLERLGHPVPLQLATDTILNSLSEDYRPFVVNYNMNNMDKTIAELHSMLKTAELNMGNKNKTKDVLMVKDGRVKKKNGQTSTSKGKGPVQAIQSAPKKGKGKGKGKKVKPNKARTENRCFICNEIGHWRQNCPKRHEAGRNHSSTQQLRKVAVLHIQELEVSPGSYDQLLNNSYKCCRLKVAQIFDRVANIGRDPRLRLLLGIKSTTKDGNLYYVTFIDDYSRYGYVYLIKHKSDTFEKFKEFKHEVENQLGRKIKILHSDRGGEYLSLEFNGYLKECGIVSQLSPPRTPQHNGVAERRNRTLLDMVRSMMTRAPLSIYFWGYALETTAYILNLVPAKKVEKTPHEMWTGKKPSLAHIKVWGCEVFVRHESQDKLADKSEKCLFIGYPQKSYGYLFYRPTENVVFVARRGVFRERELIAKEVSGSNIDFEEVQESNDEIPDVGTSTQSEVEIPVEPVDESLPLRRSTRVTRPPEFYGLHITAEGDTLISDSTLVNLDEPASYKEAMEGPEAAKWKEAMDSEIQSMHDNQVWILVDQIPNRKTIGRKWIFKKKTDMDGNVQTFKARLVAKGYTQTQGVDYDETFSLVAKIKSIRIMLAIAAFYDYEVWQMDVKTAFLNGKLSEDVYMTQPEGFVDIKHPNRVCKLEKSIYGLKQASRSWNLCFHEKVKAFGFSRSEDESCIYVKASGSIVTFLVLYVDDILLIGNDIPTMNGVKSWLGKCFAMKDLGEATYILGIRIYRDRTKRLIGLSQSTYVDKVLKKFNMENSKKGSLPIHQGIKLCRAQCPLTRDQVDKMSRVPYASAIGSIMYAMTCTRPDVSYALSMVSRYQGNPGESHWTAVKNILKYLRNTRDMFLVFGGSEGLRVTGYTDASFQTDVDNSCSQSGWVFLLNGGAVTWKSSKQPTVAESTCESEYIAASEAAKEATWLQNFIGDLGVVPTINEPIEIFCDNTGAIALTKEPKDHGKSRHIKRKFHYVRHRLEDGDILVSRISSEENPADPFTKALSKTKHDLHARSIGLRQDFIRYLEERRNKLITYLGLSLNQSSAVAEEALSADCLVSL